MLASSLPVKFNIPFANNSVPANINQIPQASQIGITGGAASLVDGFPPLTYIPITSGGIPPWGRDFQGLLNQITAWVRYCDCAGGIPVYDAIFASAVGGYPQGAVVAAVPGISVGSPQGGNHLWLSAIDNNVTNPDTVFNSPNWIAFPSVIDFPITYTVHGTNPQFADLNVAMEYLTKFNITRNGSVVLQLAGAASGAASQFIYNKSIILDHPNMDKITIRGNLLGTFPSQYTTFASSAAFLSMLRATFATELRFTGINGMSIQGSVSLNNILLTADGSGTIFTGAVPVLVFNNGIPMITNVAAHGGGGYGIVLNNCYLVATNGWLSSTGNGWDGMEFQNASMDAQVNTIPVSSFNGNNGYTLAINAGIVNGPFIARNNTGHGIIVSVSQCQSGQGSAFQNNGKWGIFVQGGGYMIAENSTFSGNGAGAVVAILGSGADVHNSSISGTVSPPLNTVGNENSYIYG